MAESAAETLVAIVLTQHQIDGDGNDRDGWRWWCTCPAFGEPAAALPRRREAEALAAAHVAHEVIAVLAEAGLDLRGTRWVVGERE